MKIRKQVTRYILIVILCSLVVGTWAQGVKIYKSGSMIKVPYAELDSIVTYTEEDDKIEEERERINHPIVGKAARV